MLDHAVGVRGAERLREQRDPPLVDRRRAHLHRRGLADLRADHDPFHTLHRKRRNLGGTGTGEVDARRPGLARRRSGDRAVHQLEPRLAQRRSDPHGRRRGNRVQVGDERSRRSRVRGDGGGDLERRAGRYDREDDRRRAKQRRERAGVVEGSLCGEPAGALTAAVERHEDARATVPQPRPERAPHGAGRDDADDRVRRPDGGRSHRRQSTTPPSQSSGLTRRLRLRTSP